jgi:hypothetical protein
MQRTECKRELLAASEFAAVERCQCGAVHVSVGALTMRLQPEAVIQLASVLGEGAQALALREAAIARRFPIRPEELS